MNYWLFKSDPEAYSFADLERDRQTRWDGVSNNLALKHLRNCKKGDQVIIYHSGEEKSLIGLAEITREAYADPKQKDPKLAVVDIRALKRLKRPITLADVKARKEFADFPLVRMPRLSVMPVTTTQWNSLMKLTGER
ncbi:MAG TPA: EVE domain-containing protein [Acidobacteriota bacterium]|nr:EVE domain-containing protein [Acidobacteriota bacterium]